MATIYVECPSWIPREQITLLAEIFKNAESKQSYIVYPGPDAHLDGLRLHFLLSAGEELITKPFSSETVKAILNDPRD